MLLVELGKGRWTVLALCRGNRSCPVVELLIGLQSGRANRALADLQKLVPSTDPAHWSRIELSKRIQDSDGIFEFRWPGKGGGTPRVLWFFDEGHLVVCCCAANKKGRMDPALVREAEDLKREYLTAKRTKRIETISYEQFDSNDDDQEGA